MKISSIVPPVVRLPPRSNFEVILGRSSSIAMVVIAVVVFVAALHYAKLVLAPVSLAVVVGLMFSPLVRNIEYYGVPPALSAMAALLLLISLVAGGVLLFSAPLSTWAERLPEVWTKLRVELLELREPFAVIGFLQDEIRGMSGSEGNMEVTVDDGGTMQEIAFLAPAIVAQLLIFLASFYFFVATRDHIRLTVLSMCMSRRLRWRAAHVFRDVEADVSQYLMSITIINIGLGIAVGSAMAIIGLPSPILWGTLAAVLNYVIFLGPLVMAIVLFCAGLAVFDGIWNIVLPPALFLSINMLEAQFVTPMIVGRRMTLNPFIVFLAVTFWLWLWGPIGGFVAVPFLLISYAIARSILPVELPARS